jgi:hypothetical protein
VQAVAELEFCLPEVQINMVNQVLAALVKEMMGRRQKREGAPKG